MTKSTARAPTATLTSKGQVTIPALVRAALGVKAGDRVGFVQVEPGHFELVAATQSVTALKGLVRKPASPVTIATMNEAIAAHGSGAQEQEKVLDGMIDQMNKTTVQASAAIDKALAFVDASNKRIDAMERQQRSKSTSRK